jgi:isocitrate dehydrogenase (NAD+)
MGDNVAVFEPTHGSAPRYVGQNKVNPMAMMLSATMMLRHIGEIKAADKLEKAIADVIAEGRKVTYDLKAGRNRPAATTSEVADAVVEKLKKQGG